MFKLNFDGGVLSKNSKERRKEVWNEKGIPEERNGMCKGQEVRETTVHLEPTTHLLFVWLGVPGKVMEPRARKVDEGPALVKNTHLANTCENFMIGTQRRLIHHYTFSTCRSAGTMAGTE